MLANLNLIKNDVEENFSVQALAAAFAMSVQIASSGSYKPVFDAMTQCSSPQKRRRQFGGPPPIEMEAMMATLSTKLNPDDYAVLAKLIEKCRPIAEHTFGHATQ